MTSLLVLAARNILRSRVRTIGVALIVGLTLGIFLILAQVDISIVASTQQVLSSVQNIVTVQEASSGSGGFGGGFSRTPITANIEPTVGATSHVTAVQRISLDPLGLSGGGGPGSFQNVTLVESIDTTSAVVLLAGFAGGSSITITQGRTLNSGDEQEPFAIVGETYASDHGVSLYGTINVNGTSFTVVGMFSTGSKFTDRTVIVPYPAGAQALHLQGPSLLYVTVDNPSDVQGVVTALQGSLGSSYQVTSLATAQANFLNTGIATITSSAQLEEYATLAAGAGMMIVVMVLVTSHRTREIGLMKALGYANRWIVTQLLTESVILSLIGLPIALAISVLVGPELAQLLLGSSGSSSFSGSRPGGGGGGFGGNPFTRAVLQNVTFSVSPEVILIGLAVTMAFGLAGAIYPILRAVRLRPTEALRHE